MVSKNGGRKKKTTSQKPVTFRLNPRDNVAVSAVALEPGARIDELGLVCQDRVPPGHKIALEKMEAGAPVFKYGQVIGFASLPIHSGAHVHTHNLSVGRSEPDYDIGAGARPTEHLPEAEQAFFEGIVRADGQVGTRNYIGVLPTVNCSASVTHFIARQFTDEVMAAYPNVDGVVALGHGGGCSAMLPQEDLALLQRTMAGYAHHPNFAGVVLVGLGCEYNQVKELADKIDPVAAPHLRVLDIQEAGGTEETVRLGVEAVREFLPTANRVERRPVEASHLVVGLECGGSDAYSGLSANPALGAAMDQLVRHGGTAVLSETPEIYGAEHLLTRRAQSREVGERLIERVRWWEEYAARMGGEINNNPSPGNKAGGLTTILEKSLGAIAKGGTTNLVEVYGYAERVTAKGFVFMDTPGLDFISVTGLTAGGANVICFTTGRGSVIGFKPAPSLKLASNTEMYDRLKGDMDINCGLIIDGQATVEEMGQVIFRRILETASGQKTRSEVLGFGDHEFVPWQVGGAL